MLASPLTNLPPSSSAFPVAILHQVLLYLLEVYDGVTHINQDIEQVTNTLLTVYIHVYHMRIVYVYICIISQNVVT